MQDSSEVFFSRAKGRAVVIGKVKVANTQVKCSSEDFSTKGKVGVVAEVMPKAKADFWELEAAFSAKAVLHLIVTVSRRHIG